MNSTVKSVLLVIGVMAVVYRVGALKDAVIGK
jgi:hypothetical protein